MTSTRFYFPTPNSYDPVAPVRVADTGRWSAGTTDFTGRLLCTAAEFASVSTVMETSRTPVAVGTLLIGQYVSDTLKAQTIDGNISMALRARVWGGGTTTFLRVVITAWSGDGQTFRGTLFDSDIGAALVYTYEPGNLRAVSNVPLTPVTVQEGDRVVVEIGAHTTVYVPSTPTYYETGHGGVDLVDGSEPTSASPWVEFSADIFNPPVVVPDPPPDPTPDPTPVPQPTDSPIALDWDAFGKRRYESGVDRGVIYTSIDSVAPADPGLGFTPAPYGSEWRYLVITESDVIDRSGLTFDDSSWAADIAPFASGYASAHSSLGWLAPNTALATPNTGIWLRRTVQCTIGQTVTISIRVDGAVKVYWNGVLLADPGEAWELAAPDNVVTVTPDKVLDSNILAIRVIDDAGDPALDYTYIDAAIDGATYTVPASPAYSDAVLATAPAAYWKLDETVAGSLAQDSSGNAHHFQTASGDSNISRGLAALTTGQTGSSWAVNSTGTARQQIPNAAWMDCSSMTLMAITDRTGQSGNQSILTRRGYQAGGDGHDVFSIRFTTGRLEALIWTRDQGMRGSSVPITDGRHHIAVVFNAAIGKMRFYIDGVLTGTYASNVGNPIIPAIDSPMDFLAWGSSLYEGYRGGIDEVSFHTEALDHEVVQAAAKSALNAPTAVVGTGGTTTTSIKQVAPWNGLISVNETSDGGERGELIFDGVKQMDYVGSTNFQASIQAFAYPRIFSACIGDIEAKPGIILTRQTRQQFNLTYRTLVDESNYKVHLIYNATVSSPTRSYVTISDTISPTGLSWTIDAVPELVDGMHRPTAHFVIDSATSNPTALATLESILYGSDTVEPAFPSVSDLIALFGE